MPRTKHIVVFFVILIIVLLMVAAYLNFKDVTVALGSAAHPALVIESELDTRTIATIVETDTTRENVRNALRAALAGYSAPTPPTEDTADDAVDELVVQSEPEPEILEPTPVVTSFLTPPVDSPTTLCTPPSIASTFLDSWGPVNTSITGTVRSVVSLLQDGFGIPVHQLNLPLMPVVENAPHCPQTEIVGVALDGRVIKANTSFVTDSEGIVGFALDGFGMFSKYENGAVLVSADLDQCHGHIHTIVWNGVPMSLYHYHVTDDSPYTIGCFRGAPSLP